jgi:hypothetical protein
MKLFYFKYNFLVLIEKEYYKIFNYKGEDDFTYISEFYKKAIKKMNLINQK